MDLNDHGMLCQIFWYACHGLHWVDQSKSATDNTWHYRYYWYYNVRTVLFPSSSLPLLAKINATCSAVSVR